MDNALQASQAEADPAAVAFAQLVEEVGVVRRLVAANDSSVTLGEIVQRLDTLVEAARILSRRPAMALTTNAMAEKIAEAAQEARTEDHAAITQAKDRIEKAARLIEGQTGKMPRSASSAAASPGWAVAACSQASCCGPSCPAPSPVRRRQAGIGPSAWRRMS